MIVQKYLHDLEAWNALPVPEQERVIGRTKLGDFELSDADKPANSHVAVNTLYDPDGNQLQILRANMPFGSVREGEFGTYYVAYAATPTVTERMLERMFLGSNEAAYDRILDFSTAVTGTLFFTPPAGFFDALPEPAISEAGGRAASPRYRGRLTRDRRPAQGSPRSGHRRCMTRTERRTEHVERIESMNNLHRELAPITDAAWSQIEDEARRTFKRHIAGRRVVDVSGPHGVDFSAVGLGRTAEIDAPDDGIVARQRQVAPLVELRVAVHPFPRGAGRRRARGPRRRPGRGQGRRAQDRVRRGPRGLRGLLRPRGIAGIRAASSHEPITPPGDPRLAPEAIAQAVSKLRLAGVDGPYSVLLNADLYTAVSETADHGYPIRTHIERLIPDGDIIWAPAIDGAFVLTTRGGDFDLQLGQDLSIGYLSHDADSVRLYFQQSLTFLVYTAEAAVALLP